MIAERVLHPCSKLATVHDWHTTSLAQKVSVGDVDEEELDQAVDWLLERKPRIEKKLAARHLSDSSLVAYYASSSYYKGHSCLLDPLGYDRDGKKGLPIMVYGVLTDSEGRPPADEVYPGNTGDPITVVDQVEKLRVQFQSSQVVLVGDPGMQTQPQIDTLRSRLG
jgi:transposase